MLCSSGDLLYETPAPPRLKEFSVTRCFPHTVSTTPSSRRSRCYMMSSNPHTKRTSNSEGIIVITGANGSLAMWFVESLLRNHPSYSAILAVRDDSANDSNTCFCGPLGRLTHPNQTFDKLHLGLYLGFPILPRGLQYSDARNK